MGIYFLREYIFTVTPVLYFVTGKFGAALNSGFTLHKMFITRYIQSRQKEFVVCTTLWEWKLWVIIWSTRSFCLRDLVSFYLPRSRDFDKYAFLQSWVGYSRCIWATGNVCGGFLFIWWLYLYNEIFISSTLDRLQSPNLDNINISWIAALKL